MSFLYLHDKAVQIYNLKYGEVIQKLEDTEIMDKWPCKLTILVSVMTCQSYTLYAGNMCKKYRTKKLVT